LKRVTQSLYGGLGNTLRFYGIEVDFLFQFVKQTGYSPDRSFSIPGAISNQPVAVMSRWQRQGGEAGYQRFTATDPTGEGALASYYFLLSDRIITDASFLRLKNLSVSWTLPERWMDTLSGSRIYMQGQNLWTLTNYTGLDPETQNSQSLPPLTTIILGVNVSI